MKVLLVGQLPKDVGGNYTTGIAKVVYELSKQSVDGIEYSMYATNCKHTIASALSTDKIKYYGYNYLLFKIIHNILWHPLRTIREWKVYKKCNVTPLRFELYKANFQKVLEEVKPKLVHFNGSGLAPMFFANQNPHIPILYTCHGVFQRYKNPKSLPKLYADYLTGLTAETRREIHDFFCVTDDNKIFIIPNGVDTSKFYFSEVARREVRQLLGASDNTKVFITVASVQERKGQYDFIKILEKLDIDYQYWIIGQGNDIEKIKAYCREHELANRVKLLGYHNSDELYKYYSAADIYAHASTMEGQALCEIEAYSTGLKCLVRNSIKGTIAKDELENGDYIFVNFDNPNLKEIISWVQNIPIKRTSRNNLDWTSVAEQYAALYYKLTR